MQESQILYLLIALSVGQPSDATHRIATYQPPAAASAPLHDKKIIYTRDQTTELNSGAVRAASLQRTETEFQMARTPKTPR